MRRRRRDRRAGRATKRCRISWRSVPRSRASGSPRDRLEGRKPEDMAGIDRIGIADQRLDPRRRKARSAGAPAAAPDDGRAAGRGRPASSRLPRQAKHVFATPPRRLHSILAGIGDQPLQPARCDARLAVLPLGAGQPDVGMAECLGEIVGGEADAPLRRLQRQRRPHRSRQRAGRGASGAGQVPSLRPPSTTRSTRCSRASSVPEIWMRGSSPPRRRTSAALQDRGEVVRIVAGAERRSGVCDEAQLVEGAKEQLGRLAIVRRLARGAGENAGERFRMGLDQVAERLFAAAGSDVLEPRQRRLEAVGEVDRPRPVVREKSPGGIARPLSAPVAVRGARERFRRSPARGGPPRGRPRAAGRGAHPAPAPARRGASWPRPARTRRADA